MMERPCGFLVFVPQINHRVSQKPQTCFSSRVYDLGAPVHRFGAKWIFKLMTLKTKGCQEHFSKIMQILSIKQASFLLILWKGGTLATARP